MAPLPPVSGYRFEIFQAEPFLLARFRANRWRTGWLLMLAPAILFFMAVLSAIYGHLSMRGVGGQICRDAATFLHMEKLKCLKQTTLSSDFPMWRDIPSLFVIVALAATPYLIFRQWSSIEVLLPSMVRTGALRTPTVVERAAMQDEIRTANRYLESVGRHAKAVLVAAGVCSLMVSVAEYKLGIYSSFNPAENGGNDWGARIYSDWWASWKIAPVTAVFYWCTGTAGLYFIIIMNLSGGRVLVSLWRLRKTISYQADSYNRDGYHGWGAARGVLLPTYIAILLHGFCLVLVSISLPQPIGFWVLLPALGQWVMTLPFYVGLPPKLTRRGVVEFRGREIARLGRYLRSVEDSRATLESNSRYHAEVEAVVQRIQRVGSIKSMPFSRPRDIVFAFLQLLATASGVYALVILWY